MSVTTALALLGAGGIAAGIGFTALLGAAVLVSASGGDTGHGAPRGFKGAGGLLILFVLIALVAIPCGIETVRHAVAESGIRVRITTEGSR